MQQILEKTWKLWQSFDPSVGFKWQFQYSKNVDVSNIKNGITLSSLIEQKVRTSPVTYCLYSFNKLVRFFSTWWNTVATFASNTNWPTTETTIGNVPGTISYAIAFKSLVYGFWPNLAVTVDPIAGGTITDITAWIIWTDPDTSIVYTYSACTALMNYSNSMILVATGNLLWRYVPIASPGLPIWWKVIRVFEDDSQIRGLTMEWNYLKIWVQDSGLQTKVHYATGTFDVEYSWLVQTVKIDNQIIVSVESDTVYDYVLCTNTATGASIEYYLYRMQGTNKVLIKRTLISNWWYRTDFRYPAGTNMQMKKSVLYCPMYDGIWTFRNESVSSWNASGTLSAPVLSRGRDTNDRYPFSSIIFGNYLYTSYQVWLSTPTYAEERVNIEFRPEKYQPSWSVIWMIQDWGLMGFDKTNIELHLSYLLPTPTIVWGIPTTDPGKIKIYLRYDRESVWLAWWWDLIKTIDNRTHMREIINLTSNEYFRRDWNVLEYMIEIVRSTTNPEIAPIFFEYNHLYDFTNRIDVNQPYTPYTAP